jgi:hypothetical protein
LGDGSRFRRPAGEGEVSTSTGLSPPGDKEGAHTQPGRSFKAKSFMTGAPHGVARPTVRCRTRSWRRSGQRANRGAGREMIVTRRLLTLR